MKNLILSFSLLFILLCGAVTDTLLVRQGLKQLEDVALTQQEPTEQTQALKQSFSKHELLFCISVPHDELLKLQEGLAALEGAAKSQDEKSYIQALTSLTVMIRRLYSMNAPTLPYIL